ncbi:MAG: SPOR domain-containing protein [Candidatus Rokubacteria bacterium]|nr:SPOR domain-containing protein [Candidatus Rokubacteria bacterium]
MDPDDRDQPDDRQPEPSYEETARSIFSALWFRVVLVLIVCGVIAAVAVPYVLEWMNPPPSKTAAVRPAPPAAKPPAPPATPPAAAPPAAAPPAAAPPAAAKPAVTPAPAPAPAMAKEEKEAKAAKPARRPARAATARAPAATGAYFVQVGAFKDPERAKSLATKLRELKFSVDESTAGPAGDSGGKPGAAAPAPVPSAAPGDKYDVFVTGAPAADLGAKLTAKGLATEPSGTGVVVKPSLPLRDAVALSKDLAAEGLKVQVRRAAAPAPAAAPPAAAAGGETLHRVRVGPFADLAAARAARAELETKGYKGFIARGGG